jgi:hypothetical protein
MRRVLFASFAALAVACSSGSSGPPPNYGYLDPGPGHQVDIGFYNQPPNDTPATATPLGTSTTNDVTVWITHNDVGGAGNGANYFVFRSGPGAGTFAFDGCYSGGITSMSSLLWKVESGTFVEPPVGTWIATPEYDGGPGCFDNVMAPLEANTVYLFAVVAQGAAGYYAL